MWSPDFVGLALAPSVFVGLALAPSVFVGLAPIVFGTLSAVGEKTGRRVGCGCKNQVI
jgi:hypothetical protein